MTVSIHEDLPPGWVATTLGEACEVVGGATPDTKDPSLWGDDVAWLTPADLAASRAKYVAGGSRGLTHKGYDSCSAQLMPAGSVLFSSRAPIGYVAITTTEMCTNQGFKSLVPPPGLSAEYLYWYMQWVTDEVRKMASGTTFAEVSGKVVSRVPLLLPPTLEQQRIAAALEETYTETAVAREGLARVRTMVRALRQSFLNGIARGESLLSVPENKAGFVLPAREPRRKAATAAHLVPNAILPVGWTWKSLDELVAPGRRAAYGVLQPGPDAPGGVRLIRVGDITRGRVALDGHKRIASAVDAKFPRTRLQGGELLLSLVGTIGRVAVVPDALRGANVARAVGVLPLDEAVNAEFVALMLQAEPYKSALVHRAHEVARKTLNLEDVRAFPVPLPSRDHQDRLVAAAKGVLQDLEEVESALERMERRLSGLERRTLDEAMAGRLVAQSASDESAELLLKTIVEEREGKRTASRGRRRTVRKTRTSRAPEIEETSA